MKPNTRTIQVFEMTPKEEMDILLGKIKIEINGIKRYVYNDKRESVDEVQLIGEDFLRSVRYIYEDGIESWH